MKIGKPDNRIGPLHFCMEWEYEQQQEYPNKVKQVCRCGKEFTVGQQYECSQYKADHEVEELAAVIRF